MSPSQQTERDRARARERFLLDATSSNIMKMQRRSPRSPTANHAGGLSSYSWNDGRSRARQQLAMWRRRHLNLRTVVVVIVLSALLAPELAAIIDAVL